MIMCVVWGVRITHFDQKTDVSNNNKISAGLYIDITYLTAVRKQSKVSRGHTGMNTKNSPVSVEVCPKKDFNNVPWRTKQLILFLLQRRKLSRLQLFGGEVPPPAFKLVRDAPASPGFFIVLPSRVGPAWRPQKTGISGRNDCNQLSLTYLGLLCCILFARDDCCDALTDRLNFYLLGEVPINDQTLN